MNRKIFFSTLGTIPFPMPKVWLDAAAIAGLSNNDPVATWPDKSGNGYDATQAVAGYRPLYKTGIQNGRPAIKFDGTDDFLSIAGSASSLKFLHSAQSTIFMVVQLATTASPDAVFEPFYSGASANRVGVEMAADYRSAFSVHGKLFYASANGTGAVCNISQDYVFVDASVMRIISGVFDQSASPVSNRGNIIVNGVTVTATNSQTGTPSTADAYSDLAIGAFPGQPRYMSGYFCEMLIYDSKLDSADITNVTNYLASKWGVS